MAARWWHTPLIPVRQRQQISEYKASLVYRVSSRTARATQRNPVLKNQNKQSNKKEPTATKKLRKFRKNNYPQFPDH